MVALKTTLGACAIGVAFLCANSDARAEMVFCNKFPHLVYVAIAYPQTDEIPTPGFRPVGSISTPAIARSSTRRFT